MRMFIVLLFLLGHVVAQAPDSCPKPPTNLLCFIGLKNMCADNSTCPTGTLCCFDGCRQRCRDPSNNNRGAGTGTPRPGTCPSLLLPPPGPCVSDSDECMLDVDCDGSTKKCCHNNCFKVCVEPGKPGISAIRDRCPSPRENPECHFGLRNQCSKHSECDYIRDGMCCFDGCRRRCATPKGFPSRIEGARPGQCPVTPVPELCVSHADECEFDGDCYPGKKCCSNTCFTRCLDPVRPSGSNSSDAGSLVEGEASGKCPFTTSSGRCHIGLIHTCNIDKECPSGSYCCFDGCRRKCFDPNDDTASAQGGDKEGKCPILLQPEFCVADVDECFIDWDCVGNRKCCSNGCYSVCESPLVGPGAEAGSVKLQTPAVKCPEPAQRPCAKSLKHQCDDSRECYTGTHCCFDGCRRRCVSTTSTPGTCPTPAENLICPFGLRNTCVDDLSCGPPGTVCCSDGCRKRCMDPSDFGTGGINREEKPRPGTCPSLSPPSQFCPSDFDECKFDWDCETPTKKCCSNGCYKVCAEPTEGNYLDKCPAPEQPKRWCPVTLRNQCSNQTECSFIPDGLCCFDGCRKRCTSPDGFPSGIDLNPRPGKCPRLLPPEFCISAYDECENDGDCYPGKKCCSNDCFKRCVNPSFEEIGGIEDSANKCPTTTPSETCHVGLGHTCNQDADCINGTLCCFTGCRRQCWDPDNRDKATLNKTGTCPVLDPPPPPCAAEVDECYMDNDCVKDMKCCSNGCYKICVSPSTTSGAAAVKCPAPVKFRCTTSLNPSCDDTDSCPDDKICCFDGCRRKCIDLKSAPLTECFKSEVS